MMRRLILAAGLLAAPILVHSEVPQPPADSAQAAARSQPKPAPDQTRDATQDRPNDAGRRFFEGGPTGM